MMTTFMNPSNSFSAKQANAAIRDVRDTAEPQIKRRYTMIVEEVVCNDTKANVENHILIETKSSNQFVMGCRHRNFPFPPLKVRKIALSQKNETIIRIN